MVGPSTRDSSDEVGIWRRLFGARESRRTDSVEAAVVAVTSGKGGTGKSFFASSLAVTLSQWHRRTTLVDCDFGLGNAHLLLGLNPRLTLQHVVASQATMEEVRRRSPYGPGVVPAGSGISRLAELSEHDLSLLVQGLERLAAAQDVLVLDTAAGISPQCLLMLLLADHVVVVTNPEIAALTDAYALIKCLARRPQAPPVSVLVNRVTVPGLGQRTFDKLADVCQRFCGAAISYLGEVPEDPAVAQRRLGQAPLISVDAASETVRCIRESMARLETLTGGLVPRLRAPSQALGHRLRLHLGARNGR